MGPESLLPAMAFSKDRIISPSTYDNLKSESAYIAAAPASAPYAEYRGNQRPEFWAMESPASRTYSCSSFARQEKRVSFAQIYVTGGDLRAGKLWLMGWGQE